VQLRHHFSELHHLQRPADIGGREIRQSRVINLHALLHHELEEAAAEIRIPPMRNVQHEFGLGIRLPHAGLARLDDHGRLRPMLATQALGRLLRALARIHAADSVIYFVADLVEVAAQSFTPEVRDDIP
jgi:hypothetical protein